MFRLLLISGFMTLTLCASRWYHFVNESKTWTEAQSYCRDKYNDLATIENEQETIQLLNVVNNDFSTDLAWIGLYDDLNSWKWTLEDTDFFKQGEKEFRNWYKREPLNNLGQSLCAYTYKGAWYETSCYNKLSFICYDGRVNVSASYVWVNQYKNWTEAQSYCRQHHTDLVSIRNETVSQKILYLLRKYYYYDIWIGLYRNRSWSDKSNSTFSNWRTGEPDNAGNSQYCTAVSFSDSGKWTDENCNDEFPFLCYRASSRQYHFISVNKSWSEAQRYCRENYTDLATIENMQEMNSVINTVNGSYNGSAWIGLYDDVNSWRWSLEDNNFYQAGEREFRNWYHEPDNSRGNDLCVYMDYNGKWFDSSCDNTLSFVCYDGRESATQDYIKIVRKMTWTEARRYCREHHTDLINVRNLTENQIILNSTVGRIWIGLYRNRIWSDRRISDYQNWRPAFNYISDVKREVALKNSFKHCTAVTLSHLGQWTDENCLSLKPFFCYSRTCSNSSCSLHQYHFISVNKSWSEAQRYCRENYTDLATIDNMQEMNGLIKTVRGIYMGHGSAWIGLYDDLNSWRWSLENTELGGFKSWYVQQPENWNGQSLCVYMSLYEGIWSESYCSSTLSFICYDGRVNASSSYVYVNDNKNWTEAQSYCRQNHTDLVSIRNKTENQKIRYLFQSNNNVWIGLYRSRSWSDESNSTFSNWRTGEPDNAGNSQYCTAVSFSDSGKWTDENCNYQFPFICYRASSHQCHFISVNKSWSEAQRYCRENYTDLATIENMQEMNSVINTVNGSYNGSAWIGLYDDLNSWRWSLEDNDFYQAGEREFRNWYHQPDNRGGRQLCVCMDLNDGTWFDESCDSVSWFICYDGRRNVSQKYVVVYERKNWTEAQRHCRRFYTDLASVTNETEHQQILKISLKPEMAQDTKMWIGLRRNKLWSDQSNSSFTYWLPYTHDNAAQPDGLNVKGQANGKQCTAVSLQSLGYWTDESCFDRSPFFCYSEKYVLGIRVKLTSRKDLSESQIQKLVIDKELTRHVLYRNVTMSLKNHRKTNVTSVTSVPSVTNVTSVTSVTSIRTVN